VEKEKNNFRWLVVILLMMNIFAVYLSINSIPPLFKEIGDKIPITKTDMGMIMGVTIFASLFLSLIGGGISDKIGSKWALGASVIIVAISGALRSTVESLNGLLVYMFLIGAGLAIIGPNVPKIIGMWFPPKELATASGICMVGMGLAGAVGMGTAAGVLSPAMGGWRNVMVALGGFTLVIGILWISLYKDVDINTNEEKEKQNIRENFKQVFAVKDIWWAAVFYGLNMVGMMSVITLLPTTLIEQGITESRAGALVGIMLGVATAFKIVGGILSDRVGRRKPFLIISAIVQGICFIVLPFISGIPLITALIIAGAAIGTIVPVFLVLPVEIAGIGTALAATAGGLIFMIGNLGGFLGPIVAGKVMDLTRANWPGFIFMGTSLIIAGFCIFPIRETGQRKKHKN